MIHLRRAYEPAVRDGSRVVLVDRLWPRGVRKSALKLDAWLKDVAPSTELRQWFKHDPDKWTEFRRRYRAELVGNPVALTPLLVAAAAGDVTLLYSAHDIAHNQAVVLKELLDEMMADRGVARR
ncbi:MAG TPA: DUF488 family protein [Gemmatimonadales bacterium]|jgi:uncharacterized protein YeaO (DUF488 family)|nr:DUF488 family protein [Gemmatimonadales bacterium]